MKHGRTLGAYGKLAVGGEASKSKILLAATALVACLACTAAARAQTAALDGAQAENLVRRSYPAGPVFRIVSPEFLAPAVPFFGAIALTVILSGGASHLSRVGRRTERWPC